MWSQVPFSLIMWLDSQVIAGYLSKGLCSSRGCAPPRRENLWACFTLSFSSFLFALPCFQIICSYWEKLLIRTVYVNNVKEEKKKRKLVIEKNMCISCPLNQCMHFGIRYLCSNSDSATSCGNN